MRETFAQSIVRLHGYHGLVDWSEEQVPAGRCCFEICFAGLLLHWTVLQLCRKTHYVTGAYSSSNGLILSLVRPCIINIGIFTYQSSEFLILMISFWSFTGWQTHLLRANILAKILPSAYTLIFQYDISCKYFWGIFDMRGMACVTCM